MSIGNRIRKERKRLNLSLEDVANHLKTTKQAIYKYENDIVTNIPPEKIEKLAEFLHVSPSYLFGWDEKEISHGADDLTEGEKKWLELYYCISEGNRELLVQTFIRFGQLSEESQRIVMNSFLEDISRE